jgi:hypothetical protein
VNHSSATADTDVARQEPRGESALADGQQTAGPQVSGEGGHRAPLVTDVVQGLAGPDEVRPTERVEPVGHLGEMSTHPVGQPEAVGAGSRTLQETLGGVHRDDFGVGEGSRQETGHDARPAAHVEYPPHGVGTGAAGGGQQLAQPGRHLLVERCVEFGAAFEDGAECLPVQLHLIRGVRVRRGGVAAGRTVGVCEGCGDLPVSGVGVIAHGIEPPIRVVLGQASLPLRQRPPRFPPAAGSP